MTFGFVDRGGSSVELVWAQDSALYRDSSSSGFVGTPSRLLPSCCPTEAVERARQDRAWRGLTVADQGTTLDPGDHSPSSSVGQGGWHGSDPYADRRPASARARHGTRVRSRPAPGCGWLRWGPPSPPHSSSSAAPCTWASRTLCSRFVGVPLLAAVVVAAAIAHPRMLVVSIAALALFVVESAFGGVIALAGRPEWAVVLHVAFAGLALAAALLNAAESFRGERVPAGRLAGLRSAHQAADHASPADHGGRRNVRGRRRLPNLPQLAVVLAGGALACAGASALNHYLDRDIDALMGDRTSDRPIVAGRLIPPRALEFGLVLSAFSFVLLGEPGERLDRDAWPWWVGSSTCWSTRNG